MESKLKSVMSAAAVVIAVAAVGIQSALAYDVELDNATYILTEDPKMFRAEKAKFWLDPDTLIDLDWDTIMRRRMLDRYNGYDLRRSLYMNPSNGEIKDEPWYSFGQSYSAQYVGEYLTAQGLDKDYEDRRLWIDNKGNSNETLTLHGDLMNNKYDQHGPYGFQTVRYKVPWKYLSNTIGRGYSTDIEITYPTDISTQKGLDCQKQGRCNAFDLAEPLYQYGRKTTKFPVVAFAYGGDEENPGQYGCWNHKTVMDHLASHGFIVCCPPMDRTGETMARCIDFLQDEAKKPKSPYYGKVGKAAGVVGWSSGGARAINAVAHPEGRAKFSALVSLVACNKACSDPLLPGGPGICIYDPDNNGDLPNANYYITSKELRLSQNIDTSTLKSTIESAAAGLERVRAGACPTNDLQVKVPAMYGAGTNDDSSPASGIYTKFQRGRFPGIFVERESGPASRHPQGGTMLWVGEITAFLKLHIGGDLSAAPYVWGTRNVYGSMASYNANRVYARQYNTQWGDIARRVADKINQKRTKKW